jgi:hypothetical protein
LATRNLNNLKWLIKEKNQEKKDQQANQGGEIRRVKEAPLMCLLKPPRKLENLKSLKQLLQGWPEKFFKS